MHLQKNISYQFLRLTVPVFAGTGFALTTTPSLAATFASSETSVEIFNFSHQPTSTFIEAQTNTFTQNVISPEPVYFEDITTFGDNRAQAEAQAVALGDGTNTDTNASAIAIPSDSFANASSFSISSSDESTVSSQAESAAYFDLNNLFTVNGLSAEVLGEGGSSYQGISQASSTILGNFFIAESEVFSFDFEIASILAAVVEQPQYEKAKASADISFALLGGSNEQSLEVFDFFSFSSYLTPENNYYSAENSNYFNVNLVQESSEFNVNGFGISGSYQRDFTTPTYLTLVEVKHTQAATNVPEPLSILGAGTASVLGAIFKRRLSKKHQK